MVDDSGFCLAIGPPKMLLMIGSAGDFVADFGSEPDPGIVV